MRLKYQNYSISCYNYDLEIQKLPGFKNKIHGGWLG